MTRMESTGVLDGMLKITINPEGALTRSPPDFLLVNYLIYSLFKPI